MPLLRLPGRQDDFRPASRQATGLYEAEAIHRRRPWRSSEAVEFDTLEWVDWFNSRRLLEPIGAIPPTEGEEQYYVMVDRLPIVA